MRIRQVVMGGTALLVLAVGGVTALWLAQATTDPSPQQPESLHTAEVQLTSLSPEQFDLMRAAVAGLPPARQVDNGGWRDWRAALTVRYVGSLETLLQQLREISVGGFGLRVQSRTRERIVLTLIRHL